MVVLNHVDRYRLYVAVVERVPLLAPFRDQARAFVDEQLAAHRSHITQHNIDMPSIVDWQWQWQWQDSGTGGMV